MQIHVSRALGHGAPVAHSSGDQPYEGDYEAENFAVENYGGHMCAREEMRSGGTCGGGWQDV